MNTTRTPYALAALLCLLAIGLAPHIRAGVPEPDTIVYGTLQLDGLPVPASRSEVVVEARRATDNSVVASYSMGSNPLAGNAYVLRLHLESAAPLQDPLASLAGDTLRLAVSDASGMRGQVSYVVRDRGTIERVDLSFGTGTADSDLDTLPDAWEVALFGGLGQGPSALGANGQTVYQNYVAGTDPRDAGSLFDVEVTLNATQVQVSFLARKAEGTGYEGRTRFYTLQSTTDVAGGWLDVSGFTRVTGNNQVVLFTKPTISTNPPTFYRGRVWLE